MVTLTNHVILGPYLHCALPLVLWGFSQHPPAKYRWRSKKVLPSERGALALCHMVKPALVIVWRLSPRLESKPCSVQPACDANHVTSRRCWCLQEGCLEHALIGGVTFAFFSLSELRRRKLFWVLFWFWNKQEQQATTATYFSSTSTF